MSREHPQPAGADKTGVGGLDPRMEPNRWEALVGRINVDAAPLLEARRRRLSVEGTLATWRKPVFAAAGGLMAAAVLALTFLPGGREPTYDSSLAEVVIPWSVAAWMDGTYAPTVEELVEAVEEYTP